MTAMLPEVLDDAPNGAFLLVEAPFVVLPSGARDDPAIVCEAETLSKPAMVLEAEATFPLLPPPGSDERASKLLADGAAAIDETRAPPLDCAAAVMAREATIRNFIVNWRNVCRCL